MTNPLVSIVIPVYNGENYLREAIDSALAQSYGSVEVIVVNDGSNDQGATERIALSYGDKVRYFYKENGGVATALNLGIQKMQGEYFSWLSHDDVYYPHKIARQIQALREHGNMTAIVHSDYNFLEDSSKTIIPVRQSRLYSIERLTNSVFPVLQGVIHGCSLLIHRSHFARVGAFREDLVTTQDYDLWFRMLRLQRTVYIAEPLLLARVHDAQGSRSLGCHYSEREQLYIDFLQALTELEMYSMYGNSANFYYRMGCFFRCGGLEKAYRYANQSLQETEVPQNMTEQLLQLQQYLKELSGGKAENICIFGAGEYGIQLYQELRNKMVTVQCFADNNSDKWGYFFDSIDCIAPQRLLEKKETLLVIVAMQNPNAVVEQLRSADFPYITTKQALDEILLEVSPVKWITSLENIEGIDYSSKEAVLLIQKFNQIIFEICKYYESRIPAE